MAYIKCEGLLNLSGAFAECSTGFINSQPDYDVLLSQLVALNEFDPVRISLFVVFNLVAYITGFGLGIVINYIRRL